MPLGFIIAGLLALLVSTFIVINGNLDIKNILSDGDKVEYLNQKKAINGNQEITLLDLLVENQNISNRDKQLLMKLDISIKKYYLVNDIDKVPTCANLAALGYFSESECSEISNKDFKFYSVEDKMINQGTISTAHLNPTFHANQIRGAFVDKTDSSINVNNYKNYEELTPALRSQYDSVSNAIENNNLTDAAYLLKNLSQEAPTLAAGFAEEIAKKANNASSLQKAEIINNLLSLQEYGVNLSASTITFMTPVSSQSVALDINSKIDNNQLLSASNQISSLITSSPDVASGLVDEIANKINSPALSPIEKSAIKAALLQSGATISSNAQTILNNL